MLLAVKADESASQDDKNLIIALKAKSPLDGWFDAAVNLDAGEWAAGGLNREHR